MSERLVLGPLLSVESDDKYVVCFLTKTQSNFIVQFNDKKIEAKKIGNLNSGFFYRVSYKINQFPYSSKIKYKIIDTKYGRTLKNTHGINYWEFYIPAKNEKIKFISYQYHKITI